MSGWLVIVGTGGAMALLPDQPDIPSFVSGVFWGLALSGMMMVAKEGKIL